MKQISHALYNAQTYVVLYNLAIPRATGACQEGDQTQCLA